MGWVYKAPEPHTCKMPFKGFKNDGSIWLCPWCGTFYMLRESTNGLRSKYWKIMNDQAVVNARLDGRIKVDNEEDN